MCLDSLSADCVIAGWPLWWSTWRSVLGQGRFTVGRCYEQFFVKDIWPQYMGMQNSFWPHRLCCGYWHISQEQHVLSCQWFKGMLVMRNIVYTVQSSVDQNLSHTTKDFIYLWRLTVMWVEFWSACYFNQMNLFSEIKRNMLFDYCSLTLRRTGNSTCMLVLAAVVAIVVIFLLGTVWLECMWLANTCACEC